MASSDAENSTPNALAIFASIKPPEFGYWDLVAMAELPDWKDLLNCPLAKEKRIKEGE